MATLADNISGTEYVGRILWSISSSPEGEIPWLRFMATMDGSSVYGIPLQYAALAHNHNGVYSLIDHNHDGDYAAPDHNHDSDYAAVDHNHDSDYAAIDHNHDSDYMAIDWIELPTGAYTEGEIVPVSVPKAVVNTTDGNVNLLLASNNRHGMVAVVNYTGNNTVIVKNEDNATLSGGGVAPGEVAIYVNVSGGSWFKH